ncbi:L-dopachrome tautomerase-related protein [Cupriavidus sp. CuC1]|uniref:L-dopachrome tautomerase-related protein n=1 Tax=Cupriavidus sp. CuC1 TaxID=3373131 RepID=UPI0037D36C35
MTYFKIKSFVITALLLAANACSADGSNVIRFSGKMIYPESISWSENLGKFFVSSVFHGTVGTVSMSGKYTPYIDDPRLVSTFGLRIDDAHDRIWVLIGDVGTAEHSSPATTNKLSAVAVYNTRTRKRLGYYDLTTLKGGAHLANDVAVDADGNAYITDSHAAVIYRISSKGNVSIFAKINFLRTYGEGSH